MNIENLDDRAKILELADAANKNLLDIGVGRLAVIAAREFNCNVTSIDISPSALKRAQQKTEKENLSIVYANEDATNLSYNNNSFDIVISYAALHHIPSLKLRQEFVKEAFRTAKEKIVIADFNRAGFPHSDDEYRIVDFDRLEKELTYLGRTDTFYGKKMNVFICYKSNSGIST
jgi:ubiquinone/menaquinone biosynthesis C-methylase UbiE